MRDAYVAYLVQMVLTFSNWCKYYVLGANAAYLGRAVYVAVFDGDTSQRLVYVRTKHRLVAEPSHSLLYLNLKGAGINQILIYQLFCLLEASKTP